jgi:hypothetical protein
VLGKVLVAAVDWVVAVVEAAWTAEVPLLVLVLAVATAWVPLPPLLWDCDWELLLTMVMVPVCCPLGFWVALQLENPVDPLGLELPELRWPFRSWADWVLQISDTFIQPSR